jgi:hypothetical protein
MALVSVSMAMSDRSGIVIASQWQGGEANQIEVTLIKRPSRSTPLFARSGVLCGAGWAIEEKARRCVYQERMSKYTHIS